MARINLEVQDTTKSRWEKAADKSPEANGNLSSLIRLAVENEISGRSDSSGSPDETAVIEELSAMAETNERIHHALESLQERIEFLELKSRRDPDQNALKNEVFSLLPTVEDFEAWHYDSPDGPAGSRRPSDTSPEGITRLRAERGGDLDALSEVLDAPKYRVHDAIDKLMEETALIREVEVDGEMRYCKEV